MTYSPTSKNKHVPQRSCVICRVKGDKKNLIRIVRHPDGGAVIDVAGKLPGRGAYICPDEECISRAKKSGLLAHSLGTVINDEFWNELEDYAKNHEVDSDMKIRSVLGLSRKAGVLIIGTDNIACNKHKLLVMTAKDCSESVREFSSRYEENITLNMTIEELSETIGSGGGVQILALPLTTKKSGFADKIKNMAAKKNESITERGTAIE